MKKNITSRDYELISAYLDNQQGSKERALFEARLKTDFELRKELQEISKTRLLVRRLPRLRAPHNYYVKAEATRARPTLRLAPVFGIVSAVASVLLALVIFGSSFFSTSPQVAMAPNPNARLSTQPEVERSAPSPVATTEAPPVVLMGAPISLTPTPSTGALAISQTEGATPTTIYLYAYPPTPTHQSGISIFDKETETARISCEEYYGGGTYPTPSDLNNCPTPTSTASGYLERILPTSTPTAPTPNASPTPTPTATPPLVEKLIPSGSEVSSTEAIPPNQSLGAGNPIPANQAPSETPTAPNVSFLNYILLTVEISLAAIAIFTGITAIILRVRAR
jgi:hypothetical protein